MATMKLKLGYANTSNRTYSIKITDEAYNDSSYRENAKTKIRAFNTAAANSSSSVAQTFVDGDTNSPTTGIIEASVVKVNEEVIYNE